MRLAKFLSLAGICSRRHAGRLIDAGLVTVNGQLAGHLTFVDGNETIIADGKSATLPEQYHYIIYHKPVGIDCVFKADNPNSIINQLNLPMRLFPVGRIDKDSHGLMLLTNDGDWCNRLLSPQYEHPKRYLVSVEPLYDLPDIDEAFVASMSNGIVLNGVMTLPCEVELLATNRFAITLHQGLNRQIRRMAKSLGYLVVDLQRVSMGNLELGDLAVGQWRDLSAVQVLSVGGGDMPTHISV